MWWRIRSALMRAPFELLAILDIADRLRTTREWAHR
jgi:hypothetical protein